MANPDLAAELGSWQRTLTQERKSAKTIRAYAAGVTGFLDWCERTETEPVITRATATGYLASLADAGQSAATMILRQRGLRLFTVWLVEEDLLDSNPIASMALPRLDEPIVPKLDEDELKALIEACAGKRFTDRRDELAVRLMVDCGARCEELLAWNVADLNQSRMVATIRRGKGGKGRLVPYQPATAVAIDRYMRLRRRHPSADLPVLFLAAYKGPLGYGGLYQALVRRADLAGIDGFHPHRLRHTAASRWLAAGGSEGGLMAVTGWRNRAMLDRYVRDTAAERAIAEARRLELPEL